ncbi:MAG: endonuclease/exonuclease/phosphatase family protein [Saprospiraceae bacterium]|nr:endonuclease/exonuclease/phosphatase family protein [Saprospiraceae bacterium]MCF8252781.1 endonuclease/exonuclease/phosphatase family protein [Saprospiraceae bacterium]MCF8283172.1 endonuclease/exonuclease/phosphatase family protein [Bacteroidales bacterium]MCF8314336.1 endonuclease/exonuclease/phosphatase family protein [Saprospiraceae bacterium]MCF8443208.1 endonuclease/exonuclease/phosphatase family protein [Saprospiraceae bacterium]
MTQKLLSHPLLHLTTAALVAFGVFVSVYPHAISSFSWVINYAVQLMLAFLFGGFVFLFFKQPRLTFLSFGGCLLLCFYLKFSIKNNSIERWRNSILKQYQPHDNQVRLKVAQFNLSNSSTPEDMANSLRTSGADILSIHEVNPGWSQWLEDSLRQSYPYHHTMVDLGIFGMAIYSRFPLSSVDTFYYHEIPNLRVCLQKDGMDICLISVHTEPALNEYSLRRLEGQLETVSAQITRMDMPLMVMGDFNSVSWSKEIQQFMDTTGLLESRSGFMDREGSFWGVPVDHIFYSQRLGCADFVNFSDRDGRHIGIMAAFQINPLASYVKKTAE